MADVNTNPSLVLDQSGEAPKKEALTSPGFISTVYPESRLNLTSKLTWLFLIRMLTATVLFGSTVALQLREGQASPTAKMLYMLIVGMYGFSALTGLLQYQVKRVAGFVLFQLLIDTAFVTALIYVTGGPDSIFSFVYFINIIVGAQLLFAPGAFYTASISALAYSALVYGISGGYLADFDTINITEHSADSELGVPFYNLLVNVFGFYLVAFLASLLSGQILVKDLALRVGQDQLRKVEALKNRIVENIESGVFTIDSDGNITSFNRAARHITGLASHQLFRQSIDAIFPEVNQGIIPTGRSVELPYTRLDDKTLVLGLATSPLKREDGEKIGTILIFEDRTELRLMEHQVKQEERLAAIGRLAAGIAHEIRNPLASISGSIQMLQYSVDPNEEDARLMNIVVRETERLNQLITDFLQYVGHRPLNKVPVNLDDLIQDVVTAASRDPKIQGKVGILLALNSTQTIMGEPNQLRQVLWNLILNGADAVDEGGQLWIKSDHVEEGLSNSTHWVELRILDNGCGIRKDILPNIFDPFFSTKTKGTGLGLALVERILQNHDGSIFAQSRLGGGTEFVIRLPIPKLTSVDE